MGKIKGRYQLFDNNGNLVEEKELNGNCLFYMLMDPDGEENPDPDTERISAGLLGDADIEDFIENVTEIIAGTLEQIAKMKKGYGAPIMYHYLASYTARAIGRHATDRDKEILNILQGEEE